MSTCKHDGCERDRIKALGYCNAHYLRFTRGTDMDKPIRDQHATDEERFWAKVTPVGDCWIWTGATTGGYGVFRIEGRNAVAHRISYAWENGEIPDGYEVDHMCFNRACVNPGHLRLLDHQQNGQNRSGANANSRSGVRGVHRVQGKWVARVSVGDDVICVGRFDELQEAENAVTEWRRQNMPASLRDAERRAS